jgi:hypothetical protein
MEMYLSKFRRTSDNNKQLWAGCPKLMPIILATEEAEIRRIVVRSQPGQIV